MRAYEKTKRAERATESFKSAADAIGPISEGMSIFTITRGQWSMIDAILHCLDSVSERARLTLWTWTVAEYEIQCLTRLMADSRLTGGRLVIDHGARNKNASLIADWKRLFGSDSVRYCLNHSKIATLETGRFKLLLRGSMNLNFNPRFEQFDLSEGGPAFDLVRGIENELPVLGDKCSGKEVYKASRVAESFDSETLDLFKGAKVWAK